MIPAEVMDIDPLQAVLDGEVHAVTRGSLVAAMSGHAVAPLNETRATQVVSRYRLYTQQLTATATETLLRLRAQKLLEPVDVVAVPAQLLASQATQRIIEIDRRFMHDANLSRRSMNRFSRFMLGLTRLTITPSAVLAGDTTQTFAQFIDRRQQRTMSTFVHAAEQARESFDTKKQRIPQQQLQHAISQTLSVQLTEEQQAICDARVEFCLRNGWANQQIPDKNAQR